MHRFLIVLLAVAAQPSLAGSGASDITVSASAILEPAPAARASAGYLSVTNRGDDPIRLTGVESDYAVRIHESVVADGVMRSEPRRAAVIYPGATARFEPGGPHMVFTGMREQMKTGASVNAVLVFDGAIRVPVTFEVRAPQSGDTVGSGDMALRNTAPQAPVGFFRSTTSGPGAERVGDRASLGHGYRDEGSSAMSQARGGERYGTNPDGTRSQIRDRGNERLPRP